MPENTGGDQGKLEFVRQILLQDPEANYRMVNQAWQESGREGTISRSSVGKIRAEMGLTDRSRPRPRAGGETPKRSRTRRSTPRQRAEQPTGEAEEVQPLGNGPVAPSEPERPATSGTEAEGRVRAIEELETDLDRLLFRVMNLGGLTEVEELLRRSRRLLILGTRT